MHIFEPNNFFRVYSTQTNQSTYIYGVFG